MPFAHVIVPPGVLNVQKRQKMVELVTDAIIAAEEAPPEARAGVTVLVSEAADGGWGIAGKGYTTPELGDYVKDLVRKARGAT